ncbi:tetratricopeptide repeat protein [Sphingobacterium bovistauri]|uniref:Tetratricopeptide repeat-containing protein n=1 Tax=Sphingobacterium bovistauri TaxID=2781959 RepID=A0ABS7Z932_9SPHI|nr:hypothetical protein [Sphingobacterium bovistauri]MCA5006664.1 hypothetical protein [Sphingobacterium bovistauri]
MKFFAIVFYLSLLFGCVQNNSPISQEVNNLNNKANNHFKNKEYSSAISSFDKLLKIDMANKKEYLYHRGICKSYIGDYGGAKKDLLNALDTVSVNSKYIYQVLAENTIKQFNDTSQALR